MSFTRSAHRAARTHAAVSAHHLMGLGSRKTRLPSIYRAHSPAFRSATNSRSNYDLPNCLRLSRTGTVDQIESSSRCAFSSKLLRPIKAPMRLSLNTSTDDLALVGSNWLLSTRNSVVTHKRKTIQRRRCQPGRRLGRSKQRCDNLVSE